LVEYGESFKDAKCDPTLFDKLKAELPGIFNYFLEGYRSWLERGLDVPTKIRADSETYVDANDAYGAFFRDHCEFDAKASCTRAEMYALYILWAKGEGFAFPLGPQALGNQLADRGVKEGPRKVIDGSRQRIWIGVKLTNTAELAVHSPKFAAALPANA
jgi:putative DNA primase/helicase